MATKAYLNAIEFYTPNMEVSNISISNSFPDWSPEKIYSKTGIQNRFIVSADECSSDLAEKAVKKLINMTNCDKQKIDFLLLCTQSPDYFLPTTACILQNKLGLPTSCGALDFNLGCSGYIYGLAIATGLVKAGIAKNILLVTAETYSKYISPTDRGNKTLFGDAAAASLISDYPFGLSAEIGEFDLGTDGAGANNLIVTNGGTRYPINNKESHPYLYMNGNEIFSFTLTNVPKTIQNVLDKAHLTQTDIAYYILHQANKFMLDNLRRKMNLPLEKFIYQIEDYGNTVSSTIPIALKASLDKDIFKSGDKILLCGFGVGYSWGSTILSKI